MFEALRRAEVHRVVAREEGPCGNGDSGPVLADEMGAEVPFIEVGGPRTVLVASPSVLAAAPARPPAVAGFGPRLRRMEELPADEPETDPMQVSFRPALPDRPRDTVAPELIAYHRPDHPVSASYRDLAAAIVADPSATGQALLFTAAASGSGTTTALHNLAVTLARDGQRRVVVLDANTRAPAAAERLGLPGRPGLTEVLDGTATLEEAIHEMERCSLWLVPAGREAGGHSRPAGLASTLRQLRTLFHLVLVDAPPWDGRPDVPALAGLCDAVYLVLPRQDADSPRAADLAQAVRRQGGRLAGCILTQR
jgi:Mrp family chromosome partitioning ATPase